MLIYSKVTEIFCLVDEFCKEYDEIVNQHNVSRVLLATSDIIM